MYSHSHSVCLSHLYTDFSQTDLLKNRFLTCFGSHQKPKQSSKSKTVIQLQVIQVREWPPASTVLVSDTGQHTYALHSQSPRREWCTRGHGTAHILLISYDSWREVPCKIDEKRFSIKWSWNNMAPDPTQQPKVFFKTPGRGGKLSDVLTGISSGVLCASED